ncbi:MAG: ABC transporter permease [Chloracidobacterium sp.]|nr:ABC transporter permease [Chloracidobacterium sp.]
MFDKLSQLWRRLLFYLRRDQFDRELEEEMRFHLEMDAQENSEAGMEPMEARYAARRQFGNQTLLQEVSRDMWGVRSIETLFQDLRFGIRMFLKSPGLTAVLILTIALGIGFNSALFSVVNALLLNPLTFPDADRLVIAWTKSGKISGDRLGATPEEFEKWQRQSQSFAGIAAQAGWLFNLSGTDEPERIQARRVSTNFFSTLGIKPTLGRDFSPDEDDFKGGRVVILSQSLWRRRFNADPNLIGRTITLNGRPYTVVGVLPSEFRSPQIYEGDSGPELWTPVQVESFPDRGAPFLTVFARLKSGLDLETARADLNSIERRLESAYPETHSGRSAYLVPLQEQVVGKARLSLLVLFGAVGIVLLIACANVSNLLMARATVRSSEMALRLAIGASRRRLIRQLLTEGILLAVAGGGFGLLIAFLARPLLLSFSEQSIPRADEVAIDARVLLFTLSLSLIIGLVFSVLPAVQISGLNPNQFLKEGAKSGTTGKSGNRLRGLLIVIQVALVLVLTIGAGLLARSFLTLLRVNPGFEAKKVLTFDLFLSGKKYSPAQGAGFYRQLIEKLDALPGVVAAGAINALPLGGGEFTWTFFIEGQQTSDEPLGRVDYRIVTPDFFRAIGVSLKRGRIFTEQDGQESAPVGIINESMARRYWPNEDPIGKRFRMQGLPWTTIVGVVGDVKHAGLDQDAAPAVYRPHQQHPKTDMTVVMRTRSEPLTLANSARNQVREMDKDLPISNLREYTYIVSKSVAQRRFAMLLLTGFATLSLLLALFGIYGVLSYSVNLRTRELAIRRALGAQARDLTALVVSQGMFLVLLGIGVGLGVALALTRLMKTLLFGVSATDPLTFTTIALLLTFVAMLACWIPARRATKVDPMTSLRSE